MARVLLLALFLGAVFAPAHAAPPARPAGAKGTVVVVPDKFLRRWDPVTIFFAADTGPQKGGPEDHPEKLVRVSPPHPGAFTWLDRRTLQFKPAEPWPPLQQFQWKVGKTVLALKTLMAVPIETIPTDGAVDLDPVTQVSLTLPEPLEVEALARMLTVELKPLPGVGKGEAVWLDRDDFTVKVMERHARADAAGYVLDLKEPIGLGTRATVHMRLSLDDRAGESFARFSFSTAEAFRVTGIGCRGGSGRHGSLQTFPVAPQGSRYGKDQALTCAAEGRTVLIELSGTPREIGPVEGRNLVRFTPPVEDLTYKVAGKTLEVSGKFASETLYEIGIGAAPITDTRGRTLEAGGESKVFVFFPVRRPYLKWRATAGVLERFGPQRVPLEGRGNERVDLRIYPVDPFDRSFWPFPNNAVVVDEQPRPPGPGEEPTPLVPSSAHSPSAWEIGAQIKNFGSPPVSAIVDLPLARDGAAAHFGLDLTQHLAFIAGPQMPGSYLVGTRLLDRSTQRSWVRVQVTDLSLTTVEEPKAVRFVVTSLSTGRPVAGARVKLEGVLTTPDRTSWETWFEGTTDARGELHWPAPGWTSRESRQMRRLSVVKDKDALVLEAEKAPEEYRDNRWAPDEATWLQWAFGWLDDRGPQPEYPCHVFTERPVYRPEDGVHIKGYIRLREHGTLAPTQFPAFVVVKGPADDQVWKYPVTISDNGSFYHEFRETNLPTGEYSVHLENPQEKRFGHATFRMEAYRLPTFEVLLHGPDQVPLDREFKVDLTARYYAGGKVSQRPLQWRVTQFPYTWEHKKQEGFFYSSDGRFSSTGRFESAPRLDREEATSEDGLASLALNPAAEPSAQPRTYVVEATVTGADDQTVTATKRIRALPPFVLGVKVPRYLEQAQQIEPEVVVLGPDGEPLADQEVTVRLLHRQWHSVLRASDFSDGVAKYITDVVDEKIAETKLVSGKEPVKITLPISEAGVYVVEIEALDKLQRAQTVKIDLYAGGREPLAWSKPTSSVFEVATDRSDYDPGQTAAIVLKSPFQQGHALAVVEAPEGNQYSWLEVKGGSSTFKLAVLRTYVPRVPVHFVLMRGRLPDVTPAPGSRMDLGKPMTVAATAWVKVNPVEHRVDVKLEHPAKAKPGDKIDVTIRLTDPRGKPLPGEVTLWLVDQAVLALGKEARLDPLPDFITEVRSHLGVHDTRNMAFGEIPFAEIPGGDGGEEGSLFDRTTVRKNFKVVPYYNPAIAVGPDGVVTVPVELSQDLTNFKIRAKAISGPDRFGFAASEIAVRLPVIVQPALPRFVRPGDAFTAAAVTRIVEGEGGAGKAEIQAEGVTMKEAARREVAWEGDLPTRIDFPVEVLTPPYDAEGKLAAEHVTFRVAVERTADKVGDAFEVKLPIRDDRERVFARLMQDLEPGGRMQLAALPEAARAGTVQRRVLLSDQPALVRMSAGLSFFLSYPYGCTEQRISFARAQLAMRKFRNVLQVEGDDARLQKAVRDVLEWMPLVVDSNDLVSYWPGARGYVSLTAWVVQFMTEAKEAGQPIDDKLYARLLASLERSLRSDYSRFIDGAAFMERAWALSALAGAGKLNPAYAAELARRSQYLDLEGTSQVLTSLARAGDTGSSTVDGLIRKLWNGLVIRLYQGREVYGGLQTRWDARHGLILPSETRTVAEIARAIKRTRSDEPRLQVLINALVVLGRDDGWGSTNANAAALTALADVLEAPFAGSQRRAVQVRFGGETQTVEITPEAPLGRFASASAADGEIAIAADAPAGAVVARVETTYVPEADGSRVAAQSRGFVVTREALRINANEDLPPERVPLNEPATTLRLAVGDVVEEHVQVVNPDERNYVAIVVPLAAGVEPLNPHLATAPPEAKPSGKLTLEPTYVAFLDDRAAFYFDTLPKGTFDFYFRSRATVPGSFIQPPALAEMMYDAAVRGNSVGARVEVVR